MLNFQVNYTHPWLLLLIPLAVICTLVPYFRLNKRYRCTRNRIISIVLHLVAIVLGINLLAGISFSYEIPNEGNEVILLVDVTESNETTREDKDAFIQSVLALCEQDCKVGVVKFGFDQVYAAEFSDDTQRVMEQYLTAEDPDITATNLAGALKYASGLFTNPESGKIVVISDGVETDGTAVSVIKAIAAQGIKVDTACFPNPEVNEVQIVSMNLPEQHIVSGQQVVMEVTVRHNLGPGEHDMMLTLYGNGQQVQMMPVSLTKEEQTLVVGFVLEGYGVHEIGFELTAGDDTQVKNNFYRTYIHLQKFENILLIERNEGESAKLQTILNDYYKVTEMSIEEDLDKIPTDIHAMAKFEQVILVNIAYSDMPSGFEELLNRYVYDLGGGLFTVGGENEMVNGELVPHAYNRKDMEQSTYYKQMLPVNVEDYQPPIAVMIVVDASASMSMGKLDAAKEGAVSCLDALNDRDFCGVVSFQATSQEELEVLPVSQRDVIMEAIEDIGNEDGASGGTQFRPAIMRAGHALSVIENVERKHIIMVTDGKPGDTYDEYLPYIEDNVKRGITMSIVTIDATTELVENMEQTAQAGGGKYYNVPYASMDTIPSIMQQDLAIEAVAEIKYGVEFIPKIRDLSPILNGIAQEDIPPLTGYYGTVKKADAIVPLMGEYVPIYAQWKYGNGNVGSFMCDLNGQWSGQFMDSFVGETIIVNIIDNLFPMEDVRSDELEYVFRTENYTTQLNVHGAPEGHQIQVEISPVSSAIQDKFPDGIAVDEAEDNRRFTFVLKEPGIYRVLIRQLDEAGNLVTEEIKEYQAFSYSQEYNAFPERQPIGEELMTLLATDGKGVVVNDPAEVYQSFAKTLKRSYDPRNLFLILVIVLVLLDIAVRKFKFKWPHELIREYKQRKADQAAKAG